MDAQTRLRNMRGHPLISKYSGISGTARVRLFQETRARARPANPTATEPRSVGWILVAPNRQEGSPPWRGDTWSQTVRWFFFRPGCGARSVDPLSQGAVQEFEAPAGAREVEIVRDSPGNKR